MADNYLENRYNEVFGQKTVRRKIGHTLDELLTRNRSTRGYNKTYKVSLETLRQIVSVNTKIASGCNRQTLRFKLVTHDSGASDVLSCLKMGAALPELHLPLPGTEPEAFIVVCSTTAENRLTDIDLGISLQTMLLKATEIGLNGLIVGAFDKEQLSQKLGLSLTPLAVLCIGKGAERFELVPINAGESHAYYRDNGIHYVPKVRLSELIVD